MVAILPLISESFSPCTNPLVTVPWNLFTISITVSFIVHSFFSVLLQDRSTYPSFYFPSVLPYGKVEQQNPLLRRSSFSFFFSFFLTITMSGRLAEMWWSVCISKFQRILCVSLRVVHIPFVRMVKFYILARFPVDHPPHPVMSIFILFFCFYS